LEAGLAAVEELLNRNVLPPAETALNLIPAKQAQKASVNFLRGRLVWQFLQRENPKYSIDDARRYWENAVKANPDSVLYKNALGFAYYAESDVNRANNSWFRASNLALEQQNADSQTKAPDDVLTSYAGLALGLYKSAKSFSGDRRTQYINEAIKLRQTVLEKDPLNFQINKLSNNWLWTETTLADWRSLLREKRTED
jgi:hypothetical protein